MIRVYLGFLLGVLSLAATLSLAPGTNRKVTVPTAVSSATQQGIKTITRREIQLRFYAEDGSYMLASDTEYIDISVDDEITSQSWRMP